MEEDKSKDDQKLIKSDDNENPKGNSEVNPDEEDTGDKMDERSATIYSDQSDYPYSGSSYNSGYDKPESNNSRAQLMMSRGAAVRGTKRRQKKSGGRVQKRKRVPIQSVRRRTSRRRSSSRSTTFIPIASISSIGICNYCGHRFSRRK